jgi:hypothetical protein
LQQPHGASKCGKPVLLIHLRTEETGSSSSAIATTRGTGDNFSDAGLRAAAEHFVTVVGSNNSQSIANAESQVEVACKRLDDWHAPAEAP